MDCTATTPVPKTFFGFKLGLFLFFLLGICFLSPAFAQDPRQLERVKPAAAPAIENRTALVIGNSSYTSSPLTNPANDAADMVKTLKELDFEVINGINQPRAEMLRLIRQFGERLKLRRGVGLFYYAGHGVQVAGHNYLIPVDAAIRSENEVELEAVDAARVLVEMENAANGLNIVILDACRDNPFSRSWRSSSDGLAQINAPAGTFIAYSTAPGKVASDGAGRNAPYTAALLKALKIPDLSLSDVFMQVRAEVQRATNYRQTPWEASSIIGKFYFSKSIPADPAKLPNITDAATIEQEYWDMIKTSTNKADFDQYLKEFPNGRFAALARLKINQLERTALPNTVSMDPSNKSLPVNPTGNSNNGAPKGPSFTAGMVKKNSAGMELVYIPPGEFMMGSDKNDNEKPVHKVIFKAGFWMGKYEVTQDEYVRIMETNLGRFGKSENKGPAEQISWKDAKDFIAKLNAKNDEFEYFLPSEAQWEYAARAGTSTEYAFGDSINLSQAKFQETFLSGGEPGEPLGGGSYQPNAWGLYDMHGNVWEWCEDIYTFNYEGSPVDGSANITKGDPEFRILRGGSARNERNSLRSAFRIGSSQEGRNYSIGFRVAARLR